MRRILLPVLAATALVATPAAAGATSYTDATRGVEVAATSTRGTFVGTATGDLPGYWQATVNHTPLSPGATITGGSFSLDTYLNGGFEEVTGTFASGSVVLENPSTRCANQRYDIDGSLTNVGVGGGSGSGDFEAVLTHYRTRVFGHCVTYSASVSGSLSLQF
jgi:hypothetical protein